MSGPADRDVETPAGRGEERQGRTFISRRKVLGAGLLGGGVFLVLGVDLGRWFLLG